MAEWIKHSGAVDQVIPKNGKAFTLEELQHFVDGYIEVVSLADGRLMFLNEEGKYQENIKNLRNDRATVLLREAGGIPWDYVTGNVIVCTRTEGGESDEDEE